MEGFPGHSQTRLASGQVCGGTVLTVDWLTWEGLAHGGWCHPQSGSLELYKKAG